jgi:XTP/dITP diphosphohydrolase
MNILFATRNAGKFAEFAAFLKACPFELRSLRDYPDFPLCEEDGASYEENAEKKALLYSRLTGDLVIGEDSGLEVKALNGFPGVRSARMGGGGLTDTEKNARILEKLEGLPAEKRTAAFVAVVAAARRGTILFRVRGECSGVIAPEPRGRDGFGYDPIFYLPARKKTFAELSIDEKLQCSHRGDALRKLQRELTALALDKNPLAG